MLQRIVGWADERSPTLRQLTLVLAHITLHEFKGEKERTLMYLDNSLSNEEIKVDFVEKDDDWKDYHQDKEFIKLINKYKK